MEDNVREIGHDEAENGDSTRRWQRHICQNFTSCWKTRKISLVSLKIYPIGNASENKIFEYDFYGSTLKTRESACNDIFNYCKRFIYRCKKKLRLYGIRLNLVKSNLLTFHYNAHSSHLFNSQIHFPTLVRGKFLSSPRSNSLFNAFTPVFFTTHIPWWIASLGESFGKC